MLRTISTEDYQRWIDGDLKFSSPEVKQAVELMSDIWFKPGYAYGGREQVNNLFLGDLNDPFSADPPGCYLMLEPSYYVAQQSLEGEYGTDYAFFNLPPIDPEIGSAVQVESHYITMYHDRPEVRALMEYYTTGAPTDAWITALEGQDWDNSFSPHKGAGLGPHTTAKDIATIELLQSTDRWGFSASDHVPLSVSDQFFKSMADYVAGTVDLETALQQIDDSWPEEETGRTCSRSPQRAGRGADRQVRRHYCHHAGALARRLGPPSEFLPGLPKSWVPLRSRPASRSTTLGGKTK